jgi:glycosyltransferase involved in cell wall biosynthesis
MKLNIGILGTRGIPNSYGGFEQFAGYLSKGLAARGHAVSVYNSHKHPYQENNWNGVNIIHCYDPEYLLGAGGQFIYDLNCIRNARRKKFDILLVLGYTSSSVWGRLYPKNSVIITNMDGLEWKRSKYSSAVQRFLQYAEKWAVQFSNRHVADSVPIKEYLAGKYQIDADYISYGAEIPQQINAELLEKFNVTKGKYYLLIARMEPENHIETILDGLCRSNTQQKVLLIGNTQNAFGKRMVEKFSNRPQIIFAGAVYDADTLHALRACCLLYFHGHSVGGTNPSLLEAMACGALICAHDNGFNRAVLQEDAFYFYADEDVTAVANDLENKDTRQMAEHNLHKIREQHHWDTIIRSYEQLFIQAYQSKQ